MANVPFSTLYDQVRPYLPGAEPAFINEQIRKVLREFMKRTTLVRETFAFDTTAGMSTYQLIPGFGQVSSVLEVFYDEPGSGIERELRARPESARYLRSPAKPDSWWTSLPDIITLSPTPDAIYTISVRAATTLKQDATTFPEELLAHHAEAIAAGVMAIMYAMPGKPWTAGQAAKEAGRTFNGAIRTIRGNLRDGGQPNQSTFRGVAGFGA
jgi:hypothetical protein